MRLLGMRQSCEDYEYVGIQHFSVSEKKHLLIFFFCSGVMVMVMVLELAFDNP